MSERLQRDPNLPLDERAFRARSRELWTQAAAVTREIQAPPVMHVRLLNNQALSAGVAAKVEFDSVRYDTHGWWDATNKRYLPKRSGYYFLQWSCAFEQGASANANCYAALYVDGSADRAFNVVNPSTTLQVTASNTEVVYFDGTSRYVEVYAYCSQAVALLGNQTYTYFCAHYLGDNQAS